MLVTLTSGETIFEIANGYDRTTNVLDVESFTLTQETDEEVLLRASWPAYYTARAVRRIPLVYPVTFAPCASLEAAVLQARTVPLTCPRGGVITEQQGATLITYAAAKLVSCTPERIGITNRFTFSFEATNPSIAELSRIAQMDARYPNILTGLAGLTGGGSTKLDGQATADVAVGRVVQFVLTESSVLVPHQWLLRDWTDEVENADAGIVLPDDWHATTNPKFWHRLG